MTLKFRFALLLAASLTVESPARAQTGAEPLASALANLGINLLRQQSALAKTAEVNAVVSPLSLALDLGVLHSGTRGPGARELASLLGAPADGERFYALGLPALLERLAEAVEARSALTAANRIWIDDSVVAKVTAGYADTVKRRFGADVASVPFSRPSEAGKTINEWLALKTAQRIPQSIPVGALSATTQVVVTSAIHFKGRWARPFPAALPAPFRLSGGAPRDVPMLVGERPLRFSTLDGVLVIELPFANTSLSLFVAVPPVGRALQVFEAELKGQDIAGWNTRLGSPSLCFLYMPKFDLAPISRSLTPALQTLGAKTVFEVGTDLTPMLGAAGRGVHLDAVLQSATIKIDEQGGEAAAATVAAAVPLAAVAAPAPTPLCAVDRPFLFALVHKPSGTPLILGRVVDPTQH
jgi:serpin B